jgi:PAS domain S-box-containing protein
MGFLKDLPVRSKIMAIVLVANGAAVILACSAFVLYGTRSWSQALAEPRLQVLAQVGIPSVIYLAACLLGCFITARMAKVLTGPLLKLSETVKRISSGRDYSLRAETSGRDEIGVLIDGLNDMLSQIQSRDEALQRARADLEQRVRERTAQLTYVNQELQDKEERYRRLVELSPDATVLQLEGRFVYANSAALRLFGAPGPDALVGKPLLERIHPEDRPEVIRRMKELREGKPVPLREERVLRLDGSVAEVEVSAIPFPYREKPAAQVVLRDITQRKEIERMKEEFVSLVSHELRTPITSIQGSLGLMASGVMGALPAAAKPLVEIAHKNCQRLVLLINDILDVEKMAAGKMRFSFAPLELGPLVEQAIEANRAFGAQHGVRFVLGDCPPGLRVNGDADRLTQVLTNLLSNAAKFSPRDATVDVTVTRRDEGVRIAVADRGVGIPEEFRPRIFQRFSQADSTTSRQKGGTGLGLCICRTIVEKHGGKISFESEVGRGTTFFVDLPEHVEAVLAPPEGEPAPAPGGVPRVLIVEDDPQVGEFLCMILVRQGFAVHLVRTAREAARRLEQRPYDAMTLDLALPDRNGIDFLRELRAREETRRLPVLVVSADAASPPEELWNGSLWISDLLDKPIGESRFLAAVRAAVARRIGERPRILHVDSDMDTRRLVAFTLRTLAEVNVAATAEAARALLEKDSFDLVILGRGAGGLSLDVPAVPFEPARVAGGGTQLMASQLMKILATHPNVPADIRALVREGSTHRRMKPQLEGAPL